MNGILIVEDDWTIANDIKDFLTKEGFVIYDIVTEVNEVIEKAKDDVKLIIMDINLLDRTNDISGIKLAKEIRKFKQTPIIFLTGLQEKEVMQQTLNIQNTEFLTKPYRELELIAMVNKMCKDNENIIRLDDEFSFDFQNNKLLKKNKEIKLDNLQLKLLKLFIENKNKFITNEIIEYIVWGDKIVKDTTRIALISKLRKKLDGKFIVSHSKLGYEFKI